MATQNKILYLPYDQEGTFLFRKNRFVAEVKLGREKIYAHIHDPGRLKELLYEGNSVLLKKEEKTTRKTKWDIIAARKKDKFVLIHSGYHRAISENILKSTISPLSHIKNIKPEVKYKKHRYDFLLTLKDNTEMWLEVKGCTLEKDSISLFPDAPTKRGRDHLKGLIELAQAGYKASIMFLIFVESICFLPNKTTDPQFFDLFFKAMDAGINMLFLYLEYNGKYIVLKNTVNLCDKSIEF